MQIHFFGQNGHLVKKKTFQKAFYYNNQIYIYKYLQYNVPCRPTTAPVRKENPCCHFEQNEQFMTEDYDCRKRVAHFTTEVREKWF